MECLRHFVGAIRFSGQSYESETAERGENRRGVPTAVPLTDLSIKIACAKTPTIFGHVIITCCNSADAGALERSRRTAVKNVVDSAAILTHGSARDLPGELT